MTVRTLARRPKSETVRGETGIRIAESSDHGAAQTGLVGPGCIISSAEKPSARSSQGHETITMTGKMRLERGERLPGSTPTPTPKPNVPAHLPSSSCKMLCCARSRREQARPAAHSRQNKTCAAETVFQMQLPKSGYPDAVNHGPSHPEKNDPCSCSVLIFFPERHSEKNTFKGTI